MGDNYSSFELPINKENEGLILSEALKSEEKLKIMSRNIKYSNFRTKEYQTLCYALIGVYNDNLTLDKETVLLKCKTAPVKSNIDYKFIDSLMKNYDTVSDKNYEEFINTLKTDAAKSQIVKNLFDSIYPQCINPSTSLDSITVRVDNLKNIIKDGYTSTQCNFQNMDKVVSDYREEVSKEQVFYSYGIPELNQYLTEGAKPGQISVVGGRPSMGKSSLALSIQKSLAGEAIHNAQFALEMDKIGLTHKLLAYDTGIPLKDIVRYRNDLSERDKQILEHSITLLSQNKYMFINDDPRMSLPKIKEQIMLLQDMCQQEYFFIVIDLFGKISDFASSDNFARDYEKKLNDVQRMVKELNIHMCLVAQINRGVTKHKAKIERPTMADFKNAGAFEEVADLMIGVHRPFYDPSVAMQQAMTDDDLYSVYGSILDEEDDEGVESLAEDNPLSNVAEAIILKQRMGEVNKLVPLYFEKETTCFRGMSRAFKERLKQYSMSGGLSF